MPYLLHYDKKSGTSKKKKKSTDHPTEIHMSVSTTTNSTADLKNRSSSNKTCNKKNKFLGSFKTQVVTPIDIYI